MEENLTKLFELNKTLISKKEEIRKKLFEKYINSSEELGIEDSCFFNSISRKMNDKDYENLRDKYEKLNSLIYHISDLEKKEV